MEVAKLTDVTRIYKIGEVETRALNGVSLTINEGEFTSLVGPSGSGKTTLLQLIGCLDQPTGGQVFINGKDANNFPVPASKPFIKLAKSVYELYKPVESKWWFRPWIMPGYVWGKNTYRNYIRNQRADLRKETLGFVFQFFALIPTLTAFENVEMPLLLNGKTAAQRKQRVMELLDGVGMADRANNRPDQLSGGQQQRVAVARALATDPKLILADEPTANLDTENGEQVMEIMKKLNDDTSTTFVFATHDPRVIKYASRVVTLQDGLIVKDSAK